MSGGGAVSCGTPRGSRRKPITHGTDKGYQAHRRRGEVPCQACCDAHAARNRAGYQPRPRLLQPCGTVAGWHRHYRRREEPCEPCRAAKRAAWKPEYAAARDGRRKGRGVA